MNRIIFILVFLLVAATAHAQQAPASKEQQELEKQRQDLKRELEQVQDLLDKNKKVIKFECLLFGDSYNDFHKEDEQLLQHKTYLDDPDANDVS